jgi:hypothetical protein
MKRYLKVQRTEAARQAEPYFLVPQDSYTNGFTAQFSGSVDASYKIFD